MEVPIVRISFKFIKHLRIQPMNSNMIRLLPLLCFLALTTCSLTQQPQSLKGNSNVDTSSSLFIAIVAIVTLNVIVLLLILASLWCNRMRMVVDLTKPRETYGQRYPRLTFRTNTYCLIDSEEFKGSECYERTDVIATLPAFIQGLQLRAEDINLGIVALEQCERCQGRTSTIEIFKYGKLRQCWQVLFMLIISPLFLAFSIRVLATNNFLWQKFFCTQCGQQKRVRKN